jgi:hypothetical protein
VSFAIPRALGLFAILVEDLPDGLGICQLGLNLCEVGFPEALAHMDSVSTRGRRSKRQEQANCGWPRGHRSLSAGAIKYA